MRLSMGFRQAISVFTRYLFADHGIMTAIFQIQSVGTQILML